MGAGVAAWDGAVGTRGKGGEAPPGTTAHTQTRRRRRAAARKRHCANATRGEVKGRPHRRWIGY